ncbi:hypothetical protein DRB17_04150 [Ferruginivarius sediminum]|uniref:Uncharacterized protein n=1 Tax=Ferruginivarius sediminum TaxID=2661937 RepID=A0A369TEH8_9PROT|nr:hypothetical protein DRB17_04150 [Ferruginivarius sediminum]
MYFKHRLLKCSLRSRSRAMQIGQALVQAGARLLAHRLPLYRFLEGRGVEDEVDGAAVPVDDGVADVPLTAGLP